MSSSWQCRETGCTLPSDHPGPCLPFSTPTTLVPARKCDGNHAEHACSARNCWQNDPPPAESAAVLTGEVGPTRVPVDVPSGAEGLVVGPEDVLVIAFAIDLSPFEMRKLRAQLEERLPPSRFVIVAGYNAHLAKVGKAYNSDRGEITSGILRAPLSPS